MPNLAVKSFSKRIGRRTQIAVLAVVAAPVAALTLASPANAAPPYTAAACTTHSNTLCLLYGSNGSNPQANDIYPANNNTLDQWKFHASSVYISNHLGGALVYQNSRIKFCTGYRGAGTCAHLTAHGSDPFARFTNPSYNRLLSFIWNA